uniref:Uncharacterized protein n=1 Tax=Ciona savignyi TaxID=51511 RepID=H2YHF7_CIOSA
MKNFLEPHRSLSDPNLQFQHQLRKSVRKYVDELYNNAEGNLPNGEYISQPKFRPERPDTSTPVYHRKSPQYYPCNQTLNISAPPLHITGYNCTRQPAESIRAEINP